jgi:hypothetical protein
MPFVAEASRTINVAHGRAYDCLANQDAWREWMPASFALVGRSAGRLEEGARFRVRIEGVPFPVRLQVTVARRASEITWCGGVRGVLWAQHRFVFEPRGEGEVEVRSIETWSGALARLLRGVVKPAAEKVGRAQLAGLERGAEAKRAG